MIWLNGKSVLAPEILFTYKVWDSTRMADRTVEINFSASAPKEESPSTILRLIEIVLGLSDSSPFLSAVQRAQMELLAESYEAGAEDDEEGPPRISRTHILRRAANYAIDECIIYFSELRDSLRDILNEIGKRADTENIVNSDAFWRSFISKATAGDRIEHELWDFKETLTMWRAENQEARARAKVITAEDVAAFANAEGGCLVVGVRNDKTVIGIGDTERDRENRVKALHDALAEHIQYPRLIWKVHQFLVPDEAGVEKLCLLVIAAKAFEPVGVLSGNGNTPTRCAVVRASPERIQRSCGRQGFIRRMTTSISSSDFSSLYETTEVFRRHLLSSRSEIQSLFQMAAMASCHPKSIALRERQAVNVA